MLRPYLLLCLTAVFLSSCQVQVTPFEDNPSSDANVSNTTGNSSSEPEDGVEDASEAALVAGATAYQALCANCHGERGNGEPKGSSILASLDEVASAEYVIQSSMPIQNPAECDDRCAQNIVSWLRVKNGMTTIDFDETQPPETSTTPEQDELLSQISLEPASHTYRRASLILTGTIPDQLQLDSLAVASDASLRQSILSLMQGDGFREFLKRGANDRLHTRGTDASELYDTINQYYANLDSLIEARDDENLADYNQSIREEPLELIAHVVMNDLPYGEILTADYTMVNDATTRLYGSGVSTEGEWKVGQNRNQSVRSNRRKLESSDREINIPHAGILSSIAFNARWPSTATNRNRARAKYVLMHFLGYDIEATASRDFPDEALADTNNPTMNNPTCVQCHEVLDPIAGAFQNVGHTGIHFDRKGADGLDALDETYVRDSNVYRDGDRWYGDMRTPGYYGQVLPEQDRSLAWLGQQIVNDARFAEGTVKFWWPALFGEEFFHDALTEGQRAARVTTLRELTQRFQETTNLKHLLADMMMSPWYRASEREESLEDNTIVYYTGGKRLLTPEEISAKATSLSGLEIAQYHHEFNDFYGGIDSASSLLRSREMSSLMYQVLERTAFESSCSIVAHEFNQSRLERRLFDRIELKNRVGVKFLASDSQTSLATRTSNDNDQLSLTFSGQGRPIRFRLELQGKPMYLGQVLVRSNSGEVVLNSFGLEFLNTYGLDVDASPTTNKLSTENKAAYLRNSQDHVFEVDLPSGEYLLEWTSWRREENLPFQFHVTHEQVESDPDFYDPVQNLKIAFQMQRLVQRFHGRYLDITHSEIESLIRLFDAARQQKIVRGSHNDIVESGMYCTYDDPHDRRESEWGADPYDTLYAWKVVVAALMSSFEFAYE